MHNSAGQRCYPHRVEGYGPETVGQMSAVYRWDGKYNRGPCIYGVCSRIRGQEYVYFSLKYVYCWYYWGNPRLYF